MLNLRSQRIARVGIDPHLTLALEPGWDLVVEGFALLSRGSIRTNPATRLTSEDRAQALQLFDTSSLSTVAFKSGSLRMVFDTGLHLNCPGSGTTTAWTISGPQGWCFTSAPGFALSVVPGAGQGDAQLPETVDRDILDRRIVPALGQIREALDSTLHEALDVFVQRYEELRRDRPDDFRLGREDYGQGFYS